MKHNPIIVALDSLDMAQVGRIVEKTAPYVWGYKLNDFITRYGMSFDTQRIMYDMKFYDIPNTVKNHCNAIRESVCAKSVEIVTVHAHGGMAMMRAATDALPGKIAAVTVLTSFDEGEYQDIHGATRQIRNQVKFLAMRAGQSGCAYVVCSGNELVDLKNAPIKKIVPGIRPSWHQKADDQKRVMTPSEAIAAGADYLVIGRPITEADDPGDAAKKTFEEIMKARGE